MMNVSNMKNMVILNNLPSNIIEEAIVILKSNKKVKDFEKIENYSKKRFDKQENNNKEYVLKEAEILVSNYISKIEDNKKIEKKINIKKIKTWACFSTIIASVEFLILI